MSNIPVSDTGYPPVLYVTSLPKMPSREFAEIQRDLEAAIQRLKHTSDPKKKLELLRETRLLLEEANSVIEREPPNLRLV